ncbi:hypothetical protein [Coralliovum pocilloporae]|uniref:hypothetical protein n=1 Tax=Coralliovum pocilloporae TaxID=3066369 RepID=UPI00330749DE
MTGTAQVHAYTVCHRVRHLFVLAVVACGMMLSGCSFSSLPNNTSTSHYDGPPVLPTSGPDLERPLGIEKAEWSAIRTAMGKHLLSVQPGGAFEFSSEEAAISGVVHVNQDQAPATGTACRSFDMTVERISGIERWLGTGCRNAVGQWVFSNVQPFAVDETT